MSATLTTLVYAVLAKNETSYGAGATLSASTDGFALAEAKPVFQIEPAYDGSRKTSPGSQGTQRRLATSGRTTQGTLAHDLKGAGAAYSSTVVPSAHTFLVASGLIPTLSGSVYTYRPSSTATGSAAMEVFGRGDKRVIKAAYADMSFGAEDGGAVTAEFNVQGLIDLPVAAAYPNITYTGTNVPVPQAQGMTLSIGSFTTAKVRSFSFELGRSINPRLNLAAANGHAGFQPSARAPKLTITIEAELLSTFDPYTARDVGTQYAIAMGIGSTQYNRFSLNAPQAQLMSVEDGDDNGAALWTLTFDLPVSTPGADDDFSLIFN